MSDVHIQNTWSDVKALIRYKADLGLHCLLRPVCVRLPRVNMVHSFFLLNKNM